MAFFELDKTRCGKDGLCARVCPVGVITIDEDGYPTSRPRSSRHCMDCGHCMAICPTGALHIGGRQYKDFLEINQSALPPAEKLINFLASRRSIRNFKSTPLSDDIIDQLLNATRFAPTASNKRPVRWISVTDKTALHTISALTAKWMCRIPEDSPYHNRAAYYRAVGNAFSNTFDPILRGAPNFVIAYAVKDEGWNRTDCVIALTYVELNAHALGIGACWAGYFTAAANEYAPLREFLGLQEDEIVGGGQMLGMPGARYRRLPWRKDVPIRRM